MTCCANKTVYFRGAVEYVQVSITSDVLLDAQPVAFQFAPETAWYPATWLGAAGLTRTAQALIDFGTFYSGTYTLRFRVIDVSETVIEEVAVIEVRP